MTGVACSDADLAAQIAVGAGRVLVAARHASLVQGRVLGDLGDAVAQAWISTVLRTHRPDDAVLSEEAVDVGDRRRSDRVWIIDPLDGTREYAGGRDDWAVHVALTRGGVPTDSAVSLPAVGEVFRSDTVREPSTPSGRMVVSRRGLGPETARIASTLALSPYPLGSAGAKAMAVVRGEADAYMHGYGQFEWDNCAPVGVAMAAGLHCSRFDGSPIVYNQPDPYVEDFVICRPELAEPILALLDRLL